MVQTAPDELQRVHVPWYLTVLRVSAWILYVWVIVGIVALSLRIFLILFGANPEAGFAAFVLRVSQPYMQPFRDIFPPRPASETGYFDVSAISPSSSTGCSRASWPPGSRRSGER